MNTYLYESATFVEYVDGRVERYAPMDTIPSFLMADVKAKKISTIVSFWAAHDGSRIEKMLTLL